MIIYSMCSIPDDMAPPEDIEKIARAVLDIQMPKSPDQISSMIDEINNLLSNITNYQDDLKELKEQARNAQELLEKAQELKSVSGGSNIVTLSMFFMTIIFQTSVFNICSFAGTGPKILT